MVHSLYREHATYGCWPCYSWSCFFSFFLTSIFATFMSDTIYCPMGLHGHPLSITPVYYKQPPYPLQLSLTVILNYSIILLFLISKFCILRFYLRWLCSSERGWCSRRTFLSTLNLVGSPRFIFRIASFILCRKCGKHQHIVEFRV